jgi:hypothetical protein
MGAVLIFRLVAYACIAAITAGILGLSLDLVGIAIPGFPWWIAFLLIVGGLFVSGSAASVQLFFFTRRPLHQKCREWYRLQVIPFRDIEQLLGPKIGRDSGRTTPGSRKSG